LLSFFYIQSFGEKKNETLKDGVILHAVGIASFITLPHSANTVRRFIDRRWNWIYILYISPIFLLYFAYISPVFLLYNVIYYVMRTSAKWPASTKREKKERAHRAHSQEASEVLLPTAQGSDQMSWAYLSVESPRRVDYSNKP